MSDLINMSSPYCIGCDSDFIGEGSRVGDDDSGNPLVSGSVVLSNDCLAYIQLVGRAVA